MNLKPLDSTGTGTGADQVYGHLREAILHGHLEPGLVISQVQLSRQLGVSRTPLREALRMLQREGLVEGEANRMIRIAPLSIEDIEELYAVRIANEALGIRLTIPTMTASDDEFLAESLRLMGEVSAIGDIETWEKHHRAFHTALVKGAGKRLTRTLAEYYDHAERYRRLYITSEPRAFSMGAAEHEAIVRACGERDAATAGRELARHLSRTALTALTQIDPEYEPSMVRETLRAVVGASNRDSAQLIGDGGGRVGRRKDNG